MGSCGQVTPNLAQFSAQGAAFSQRQWEVAKQDGCSPCTQAALPTWPPRDATAYTYPMLANPEEVAGLDTASYGAPYAPSAAEQAAAAPDTLVCSLPPELRGSAFLPDQPLAASSLTLPSLQGLNFDVPASSPGAMVPMSGSMAAAEPSPQPVSQAPGDIVRDTAAEMREGASMLAYHVSNWGGVPGQNALDKVAWLWGMHGRSFVMWVLLVAVVAALLTVML
jgi:hypothetical protein